LILFGIRENCHSSGRNLILYLIIKGVIELTVVIVEGYHSASSPMGIGGKAAGA
jgi:hypothetical protein